MKLPILALAYIICFLPCTVAQADIYESKDAQGNTVYTDSPQTGAVEVDLPQSNIADAVEPSNDDSSASQPEKPTQTHEQKGGVVVIPDSRNEELEREIKADMPNEVLEAEQRHEVGDEITPEEARRREEAKEGILVDEAGNVERIEHRGHDGS